MAQILPIRFQEHLQVQPTRPEHFKQCQAASTLLGRPLGITSGLVAGSP